MKFDLTDTRIFLKPGVTDLRISTDEILHLIKNIMEKDPLSGAVFLFCNRRRNILKAIWWDRTGFWIAQKKLEKHRWPLMNMLRRGFPLKYLKLHLGLLLVL